jgi:DNA ligase-1
MFNGAEHDMGVTRRHLLAGLAAGLGVWNGVGRAAALPPAFLLAREAADDVDPAGFLVSEKLDGVRAMWDGRSLRLRSGLGVAAPEWFTASLPAQPLDGELWLARGRFEPLCAAVRRQNPRDAEWRQISYRVFELPGAPGPFSARSDALRALTARANCAHLTAVEQSTVADRFALRRRLDDVVRAGGEGLVLHRADAPYHTGRSDALLKLKPIDDADAVVVGHVPGRGRFTGRMGALKVRSEEGAVFLIGTGFDDATRADPPAIGSTVTYTHRGRTANGVPRFASFLRVRGDA